MFIKIEHSSSFITFISWHTWNFPGNKCQGLLTSAKNKTGNFTQTMISHYNTFLSIFFFQNPGTKGWTVLSIFTEVVGPKACVSFENCRSTECQCFQVSCQDVTKISFNRVCFLMWPETIFAQWNKRRDLHKNRL